MKFDLKLTQKAMLLIAVPLIFEFVFVMTLVVVLRQLEQENAEEAHSRDVLMAVNLELNSLLEAAATMGMYQVRRESQYMVQFLGVVERLRSERKALDELVAKNPTDELNGFSRLTHEVMSALEQADSIVKSGDRLDMMRSLLRLRRLLKDMTESGNKVIASQEAKHHLQQENQARLRDRLQVFIMLGLASSAGIAIFLAVYFNRGTSRRLNVLMNNTVQLVVGQPLETPLDGNDELATLDHRFHKMARLLVEAQHKEEAMTENALDVICTLDERARFTKMNAAVKAIWGYEPDELMGRSIYSMVVDNDSTKTRQAIEEVISTKSTAPLELVIQCKNLTLCDMSWSVHWSESEKSYFCVAHDISQRKQLERLKQEVVAMVSHDLRSPLTALQVMFELFEAGVLGELNEKGVKKTEQAGAIIARLISMINDLLDMERLESGAFELDCKHNSFADLAENSVRVVQNLADEKDIKLKVEPSDAHIFCDSERMIRVIVNLLTNAIKFSPDDSTVRISQFEDADFVGIEVTDQGRGIPPDKVDSIFERFKQVDRSDETEKRGSGLGLAICKAIVEAHQGQIGVRSEVGKGSTFWFKVPRKSAV